MTLSSSNINLDYFLAVQQTFSDTLHECQGDNKMLPALMTQSYQLLDDSIAAQTEDLPEIACHKGCAACCTVRVVATAPEVLMAARYIRAADNILKQKGIDLAQRLAEADAATRGNDKQQRVSLKRRCPYIDKGACVIYPVRPLACRGHASYDKRACIEAAASRRSEVPYSVPHMNTRSLVQNALQSALRDAGYPWATYELNHALRIALENEECETAWYNGEDVFVDAMDTEVSLTEMAQTFDHIFGILS